MCITFSGRWIVKIWGGEEEQNENNEKRKERMPKKWEGKKNN